MADTKRLATKLLLAAPLTVPRNTDVIALVADAIDTERERCARTVERNLGRTNTHIARAIRNGENEATE